MQRLESGSWAWLIGLTLGVAALITAVSVAIEMQKPSGLQLTSAEILQIDSDGFQPPEPDIEADRLSGPWQAVTLPYARPPALQVGPAGQSEPTEVTWFRLEVPSPDLHPPLYLFIPRWKSDGTLAAYADGALVYQTDANPMWNNSNRPLLLPLGDTAEPRVPHEILFRLQHVRGIGGALSSVWIGSRADLMGHFELLDFLRARYILLASSAFLMTGFYALFIWLRLRHDPAYILFFFLSLAVFLRGMHEYAGSRDFGLPDDWFGWITVNSTFWLLVFIYLFIPLATGRRRPWVVRFLGGAALSASLVTLPGVPGLPDAETISPFIYGVIILGLNIAGITGLIDSIKSRSASGIIFSLHIFASFFSGIHDVLLQQNRINIERPFFANHLMIILIFNFWTLIFRHHLAALDKSEQAQKDLTIRLREREAELTASHEKLREIEARDLLARERERLTQDMHDGMGSSLVSALRAVERGRLNEAQVADILRTCIDDLKLTIDSLEPAESDLLLLLATFRFRLQPRLEASGIALLWEITDIPPLPWLDQRHSLHILRILQEAFTNIIKHARATQIRLRLTTDLDAGLIQVSLQDNGVGFDLSSSTNSGRGLDNLRRRATLIGAGFDIDSDPEGTALLLSLPLTK